MLQWHNIIYCIGIVSLSLSISLCTADHIFLGKTLQHTLVRADGKNIYYCSATVSIRLDVV